MRCHVYYCYAVYIDQSIAMHMLGAYIYILGGGCRPAVIRVAASA
jgi:hypothetical protein